MHTVSPIPSPPKTSSTSIYEAICNGDIASITDFIENMTPTQQNNLLLLHLCVTSSYPKKVIKFFAERGELDVTRISASGLTPYQMAINYSQSNTAPKSELAAIAAAAFEDFYGCKRDDSGLLKNIADGDVAAIRSKSARIELVMRQFPLLQCAVQSDHAQAVLPELLGYYLYNSSRDEIILARNLAATEGKETAVHAIDRYVVSVANARNDVTTLRDYCALFPKAGNFLQPLANNFTLLCRAARDGNLDEINRLTTLLGSVNFGTPQTPLVLAATYGRVAAVALLVSLGATVSDQENAIKEAKNRKQAAVLQWFTDNPPNVVNNITEATLAPSPQLTENANLPPPLPVRGFRPISYNSAR